MASGVLLVVNCAADSSYGNRFAIRQLYAGRFDEIAFAVSPTCPLDDHCWNIVQSWPVAADGPECICGDEKLGRHAALGHCFHPRLIDVARSAEPFEFVVFTEDDCLLSPAWDAARTARRCAAWDAMAPPIYPCCPRTENWAWARHACGQPAYVEATREWSGERLRRNWREYSGSAWPPGDALPMCFGFSDCAVFRGDFLRRVAHDLAGLLDVWHEIAVPSTLLYNSPRLGKLDGVALWGEQRAQPLDRLLTLLQDRDYVHPIKLSRYPMPEVLARYGSPSWATRRRHDRAPAD